MRPIWAICTKNGQKFKWAEKFTHLVFFAILEDVQGTQWIPGLQDLCYSYHVPEDGGTAHISRYLQASLGRPLSKDGYSACSQTRATCKKV